MIAPLAPTATPPARSLPGPPTTRAHERVPSRVKRNRETSSAPRGVSVTSSAPAPDVIELPNPPMTVAAPLASTATAVPPALRTHAIGGVSAAIAGGAYPTREVAANAAATVTAVSGRSARVRVKALIGPPEVLANVQVAG